MEAVEARVIHPAEQLCRPENIVDITTVQVPNAAVRLFSRESKAYTKAKALRLHEFDRLMALGFEDGQVTYFAQHDKTYPDPGGTERLVYLADINGEGIVVGEGEIRYSLTDTNPYFFKKPFVGKTATETEFQGNGLGRRRLLAMNAATLLLHGLVLHSDTLRSTAATRVWQRLVNDGLAESYYELSGLSYKPSNSRFKFK